MSSNASEEPDTRHVLAEPWFLAFDATIGFHPAMLPEDLEKAGPDIAAAVEAYG